jgi:hypothetical protein
MPRLRAGIAPLAVALLAAACAPAPPPDAPAPAPALQTQAEASGWTSLTPHAAVVDFYRQLSATSPDVRMREIGRSREGRPLHLVTLARPGVSDPWEAHASGRPILFIGAQVHGDEPAGKEGLMLFARDLVLGDLNHLLDEIVFVLVPQMNPDGAEGGEWGTRTNAAGYNLNRDYLRRVNPEARAVSEALVAWRPHVVVDAHELPGPVRVYDFYTLHPRNLNGPTAVSRLAAERAIPAIESALAEHGYTHIVYHTAGGLAERPEEGFAVGGFGSRSLTNYGGAMGAVTLLFETLRERDARIGIGDRARRQRIAMEALARYVADHPAEVVGAVEAGRREMAARAAIWNPADSIAIRIRMERNRKIDYRVMEMERVDGRWEPTGDTLDLRVPVADSAVVVQGRVRPVGYAIAPSHPEIAEDLRAHGLVVERLLEPTTVGHEVLRVDSAGTASSPYEGYVARTIRASTEPGPAELPAGTFLVHAGQPNAALLFELLEPEGQDSYASTGWLDAAIWPGRLLPISRLQGWPTARMETFGNGRR